MAESSHSFDNSTLDAELIEVRTYPFTISLINWFILLITEV